MSPESEALKILASSGPLGLLCLLLLFGLRILWKANQDLATKLDDTQKSRLADRDAVTTALVQSTHQLSLVVEYLNNRRPR